VIAKDKTIKVSKFGTQNTAVKTKFPVDSIVVSLEQELKNRLTKQGYSVAPGGTVAVQGEFVMIDEGSRFLRWFIGPFGVGATKLEVEGTVTENGKELKSFNLKQKGYGGLGGGNSQQLLTGSTRTIAKKIVKLMQS
jgi:uncharacterized lipoprotein YajG